MFFTNTITKHYKKSYHETNICKTYLFVLLESGKNKDVFFIYANLMSILSGNSL